MDDVGLKSMALTRLLTLLKVAGFEKRSIRPPLVHLATQAKVPLVPKYAIRLAVVSLSLDYLVAVPYERRDRNLDVL